MKTTNYILAFLVTGLLSITSITAQVFFEDFENEEFRSDTFISEGQEFTIIEAAGEFEVSVRNDLPDAGWNAETGLIDAGHINNTFGAGTREDGARFSIITADGTLINVKSFYFRVITRLLSEPDPYTITIRGLIGGIEVYEFVIDDGFSDVNIFEPNNGYTFIDFAAAGDQDYSRTDVSRIDIATTGDGELISLDSFSWGPERALSVDDVSLGENSISIFPNPASSTITVSGITEEENYKIYNVLGAEIAKGTVSNNEAISINNFSNGLYLINFDNRNSIKFLKK